MDKFISRVWGGGGGGGEGGFRNGTAFYAEVVCMSLDNGFYFPYIKYNHALKTLNHKKLYPINIPYCHKNFIYP